MLFRYRSTIERQLVLLVACSIAAVSIRIILSFKPTFRAYLDTFLRGAGTGIACGLLMIAAVVGLEQLRLRWRRMRDFPVLPEEKPASLTLVGAALAAAGGEELLIRGFFFAFIALFSRPAAYFVNFALTFGLHIRGREYLIPALLKAFEGTLFAALYLQHRSLFLIATARFFSEIILGAFHASNGLGRLPAFIQRLEHVERAVR